MKPLSTDGLEILVLSDIWSTRQILNIARSLPRESFHRKFDIGLGSMHDTITHMVSTMRRWTDRLAGREPRPMLHAVPEFPHVGGQNVDRSPDELLRLHEEAGLDLLATLRHLAKDGRLGSMLNLEWPGEGGEVKVYTFTRAAVVVHVGTHGYHHRAQLLNMLRQLGAPVPGVTKGHPELSAVDWQAEAESPPRVKGK